MCLTHNPSKANNEALCKTNMEGKADNKTTHHHKGGLDRILTGVKNKVARTRSNSASHRGNRHDQTHGITRV